MRNHSLTRLSALLAVIGTFSVPWAHADKTPLDQTKTRIALPMDQAPIIDGVIDTDAEWAQVVSTNFTFRIVEDEDGDGISGGNLASGEKPDDDTDLSADIFTGTADGFLYIGVKVFDDDISTDSAAAGSENEMTWQDDSVEIFIDGDNSNFAERDTTGTNEEVVGTGGQYVITANNAYRHAEAGNPRFDASSGWFAETKVVDGEGYHAEFRIPLTMMGNPEEGEHVGFTVAINDDDGGGNNEGALIWTGETHVEAGYGNLVIGHRKYEGIKATPPTIDGKIEEGEYPGAEVVTINPSTGIFVVGDDSTEEDNEYAWRLTHDQEAIYVGITVQDTLIVADTAEPNSEDGNTWVDDSVEIFFDSNESNKVSRGQPADELYDGQFVFTTNGAWRDNEANNPTYGENADWWAQSTVAEDGMSYEIEFVVKKATLVGGSNEDIPMGFNININDDDAGGGRKLQLNWDGVPHFEDSYGTLVLLSAIPSSPNAVTDRSVKFGRLDQSAGVQTQQMSFRNAGDTETLTLSDAAITGPGMEFFTLSDFPTSIAPGETAFATIAFDAGGAKGKYDATLSYKTNDPDPTEADLTALLSASVANLAGPIARYSLDEAAGTKMLDVSTFDRHGTFEGGPTLGQEALISGGTSAQFSGGSYGQVPGDVFDSFIRFTVAAWVNLDDLSDQQTIFAKGSTDGAPTFALLSFGGNLEWFSNGESEFSSDAVLTAGTTHHVAVTWSTNKAVIYVDGVVVAEQEAPNEIEIVQENPFLVGAFHGGLKMEGRMDDVQFYDRAVPADDVASLHANPGSELTNFAGPENAAITWDAPNANTTVTDLIGGRSITFVPFEYDGGNADNNFLTVEGGTTGDDLLDEVYNSHGWNADGSSITLDGLTEGEAYMVQLLGAGDTRSCCNTRNQAADDGVGNVSGDFPRGNSSVIGTFTATGASQTIMIVSGTANGVDPGLSGFILTDAAGSVISAFNVGRTAGDDVTVTQSVPADEPGTLPADSVTDFGGPDLDNGWTYGYRLVTTEDVDYDSSADFIPFPETWWNGNNWDEPNEDGDNVPWTQINADGGHPNGGGAKETHWTIRRWTSPGGPTEITFSGAKQNVTCGNGTTVAVHINGFRADSIVLASDDADGASKVVNADLSAGDVVDLILSPSGEDGDVQDGCDSTNHSMSIIEGVGNPALVDLDASGLSTGAASAWTNTGSLGGEFQPFGDPMVEVVDGYRGVTLDGDGDYFEGPASTPEIEGSSPRSIIAWVYNPELASEETVISWGKRGGPDGTNMSFNHGFHNNFGAVGHWGGGGPDIGWNPNSDVEDEEPNVPGDAMAGTWTHISYTQTGAFTKVFTNGQLSNSEDAALDTFGGLGILVGAQREGNGVDVTDPLKGSLSIGRVRIFDSTLSDEDILADFVASAADFGVPVDFEDMAGVLGYWRFNEGAGGTVADSSGNGNDGTIIAPDAAWANDETLGSVYQSGGGSYVDLGMLPVIGLDTDFTWSFWVNASASGVNDIVFGNRYMTDGVDFAPREFVKFTPTTFEWHVDGAGQNVPADNTVFVEGEWSHRLVVKSGNNLTYYINGAEVASSDITSAPVNAQPLYLGGQAGTDGAALENFNGLFDEVAVFNRALSTADVTEVYNRGLAGQRLTSGVVLDPLPDLTAVGIGADGAFSATLADGLTADIEYSTDLINWEVIAPGVTGTVSETDAGRQAAPAGFYRGKQ